MRKLLPLSILTLLLSVPLYADNNRSQSYFTYDDGGTIVRQGDDNREVEARINFPVFPGDEITTSRRGRAEIRLSDGNVLALDRGTQVHFGGIRDSYEGDAGQTVIELRSGHVMLERDDSDRDLVRLDTENASYAATERAIYAVDTDRGRDRVAVYDGSIEVRTPNRTTRIRAGEEGSVDNQGLYGLASFQRGGTDDFERWFIARSERYRGATSRYLDASLAYSDYDFDRYGSWVYASDYGSWCWRPTVGIGVGWRPYYNGYWHHGIGGSLLWVSYEPWGWVPYHYGRWIYNPGYGWMWMPGYAYSPAWVYWMYGPGYIGWAPAGWYDCYRPYYPWAYRPYAHVGLSFGFGFYGRVRVHDIDLRPWTFVGADHILSTRVDRAALTADAIRQRLTRNGSGGFATVSGAPARFTRSDMRDPASAVDRIVRRGIGGGTGNRGSGSATDMTSFFRRDPDLSTAIRERVVRGRGGVGTAGTISGGGTASSPFYPRGVGSGIPTPGTSGTLEGRVPRDGGGSRNIDAGTIHRGTGSGTVGGAADDWRHRQPATSRPGLDRGTIGRDGSGGSLPTTTTPPSHEWRNRDSGGSIHRDNGGTPPSGSGTIHRNRESFTPAPGVVRDRDNSSWRRIDRSSGGSASTPPQTEIRRDNWRGRAPESPVYRNPGSYRGSSGSSRDGGSYRGSDVPRRIIDGIGGARIHGDSGYRPSGGGGSHSGGSGGGSSHPSGGGSSHPSGGGNNSGNSGAHSSGGNQSSGGHIKRN